MWLINTETLKLESVVNPENVEYAILSHTWNEGEEVTFQELQQLQNPHHCQAARTKKGFQKIDMTCRLARKHGYDYAWVDTCCIDKSSSSELSEAINSMFRWYKGSKRCYAYLSDYPRSTIRSSFAGCKWFTRGWTLQELIAPTSLTFYNQDWKALGSKHELREEISRITRIPEDVLCGQRDVTEVNVVFRMSWAAGRETKRAEDIAYCLFGIFDVNLAMLYGEGQKAFLRLQEEICRRVHDWTLFAWKTDTDQGHGRGIFAYSPEEFKYASTEIHKEFPLAGDISVSSRGVIIDNVQLSIIEGQGLVLPLNLFQKVSGQGHYVRGGIFLKKALNGYARVKTDQLFFNNPWAKENLLPSEQINIISWGNIPMKRPPYCLDLSTSDSIEIQRVCPRRHWDPYQNAFIGARNALVELEVRSEDGESLKLLALYYFHDPQILKHAIIDSNGPCWGNAQANLGKADASLSWTGELSNFFARHSNANLGAGRWRRQMTGITSFDIEGHLRQSEMGWEVWISEIPRPQRLLLLEPPKPEEDYPWDKQLVLREPRAYSRIRR
ncbi:HET domain-containing protein [Fusarium sp. LHS14.1]|nr:HET domain-containing protein [Fusarium sp. LHS14.1]